MQYFEIKVGKSEKDLITMYLSFIDGLITCDDDIIEELVVNWKIEEDQILSIKKLTEEEYLKEYGRSKTDGFEIDDEFADDDDDGDEYYRQQAEIMEKERGTQRMVYYEVYVNDEYTILVEFPKGMLRNKVEIINYLRKNHKFDNEDDYKYVTKINGISKRMYEMIRNRGWR